MTMLVLKIIICVLVSGALTAWALWIDQIAD